MTSCHFLQKFNLWKLPWIHDFKVRYNADGISPKLRRIDTGKSKNNNDNNKRKQIKLRVEKCVAQSKQGSFFLEHPFSILLRDKLYSSDY